VVLEGYTSDVTMSFVRAPLEPRQERMLELVREAYEKAVAACAPGIPARQPALLADSIFAQAGYSMPHSLGHGIASKPTKRRGST
jgi:Xaa-Pro aminopeptidase